MSTPALGTPEYTNYLIDQGKTLGLDLEQYRVPVATPPTTTSQTTTSPSLQYPTTSPAYGNTSNAAATVSGADKYFADLQQMIKDQEAQQLEQQKIYADSQKSLLGKLASKVTSPTEARQQALDTTGIIPKEYFADQKARIAEIDTLNQEYNSVVAARDQQIAGSRDKLGSNNFINNQIAQIERNAAPKLNQLSANINSKAAVMKALQGNFAEAQNFVNQAVQDAVADNKFQYDLFSTMYELNKDTFDNMSSTYKDAFENSLALSKLQYERALDEKSKVGELMLKYYNSGIQITDTLDEALAKAGVGADPYTALQMENIKADNARLAAGDGTSSTTGLSKEKQEDFAQDLAFIATFETRAEASEWLRKNYSALAAKYGDVNFEKMRAELDRLFPTSTTATSSTSSGSSWNPLNWFRSSTNTTNSTSSGYQPLNMLSGMSSGYKPLTLSTQDSFFSNLFGQ